MAEGTTSYGGVLVLFNDFITHLKKNRIDHTVIDINSSKYKVISFIIINFKILLNLNKHSHVSLHGTARNFLLLGPILVIYCKLFNVKLSLRKFAGNFDVIYQESSYVKKNILAFILTNSNCVFFETKYLVDFFIKFNKNTYWFPNVREKSKYRTKLDYSSKFIYLGNIQEEKGMDDLLKLTNLLSDDYVIDLYGNIRENKYDYIRKLQDPIVSYRGIINPSEAQKIISEYDVLILPSYREGYPGVIVEAFSVGVPVVATNLKGISEIVKNGISGILVPTNNPLKLADAMRDFDSKNYIKFSHEAKKSFIDFDTSIQTAKMLKLLLNEP